MAFNYIFTENASNDLDNIMEYISIKLCNYSAAEDLFNHIFKTIDIISNYPLSYPLVENEYVRNKNVRKAVIGNYNLYYIVEEDLIQIIRIIYSKRDASELINILY